MFKSENFIGNNISGKQSLLMNSLTKFYNKDNIERIIPYIKGKSDTSLRVIDWFATNYSKKNNIVYYIDKKSKTSPKNRTLKKKKESKKYVLNPSSANMKQFNVYLNYKSQLKAYSKKQFDPFCRRDRIEFFYDKNNSIITTVGQLNFFRWSIENHILDYIKDNLEIIEYDMNTNIKKPDLNKSKKKNKLNEQLTKKPERKKRKELSISATNTINKHKVSIVLDFD